MAWISKGDIVQIGVPSGTFELWNLPINLRYSGRRILRIFPASCIENFTVLEPEYEDSLSMTVLSSDGIGYIDVEFVVIKNVIHVL